MELTHADVPRRLAQAWFVIASRYPDQSVGASDWALTFRIDTVPDVVVAGGSFGGIAAVRDLRWTFCRITLIDRRNHYLFQPLLYQVVTAALSPADVALAIRSGLRERPAKRDRSPR